MTKYVAPCGADLSNNTHGFGQGFPLVFNIQLDVDLGVGRSTGTTSTKTLQLQSINLKSLHGRFSTSVLKRSSEKEPCGKRPDTHMLQQVQAGSFETPDRKIWCTHCHLLFKTDL